MHVARSLRGAQRWIRQSYVEISLRSVRLERPRRIHARGGRGAHEGRRLFHNGPHIRRNGNNVALTNETDEPLERSPKSIQQLIRRGMDLAEFLKYRLLVLARL